MEQFSYSGKVISGNGAIEVLATLPCKQVFIVTDASMVQLGHLKKITDIFDQRSIAYSCFDGVLPDPSTNVIAEGVKVYQTSEADVVVALGGGSVIDAAKGIMYFFKAMAEKQGIWKKPNFVAIPTTSGTGSECTSFAVITSEKGKICIIEDWLVPNIAILDESLTMGVPEKITYDTGLDVLTHSLEAYVSKNATAFTDAYAEKATRIVMEILPKLKKDLKNSEWRAQMHQASCMAGIAFSQAGLGLNHSLAHALGGQFHIPHGRANTVFLEVVLDYNVGGLHLSEDNKAAVKYAALAKAIGLQARTVREGFMNLRAAIVELKNTLGVPKNIKELGISESELHAAVEKMATSALADRCTPTAPREPNIEDLKSLYKNAYNNRF